MQMLNECHCQSISLQHKMLSSEGVLVCESLPRLPMRLSVLVIVLVITRVTQCGRYCWLRLLLCSPPGSCEGAAGAAVKQVAQKQHTSASVLLCALYATAAAVETEHCQPVGLPVTVCCVWLVFLAADGTVVQASDCNGTPGEDHCTANEPPEVHMPVSPCDTCLHAASRQNKH